MKNFVLLKTLFLLVYISSAQVSQLIQNDWQNFMWPYNAYYPESEEGINGHLGNACGYTALARICHYWQHPINGVGVLDFEDNDGYNWYIDLGNMNLDYSDMPYELNEDDPEPVYQQVATLMLACGAIGKNIQIGYSHGIMRIPEAMQEHMLYSDNMEVAQRWDYTKQEWIDLFKNELDNGRPILIDGRTPESPPPWESGGWEGHFFVCDGYNEEDEFYINYSYGGISGYYDIDDMDDFSAYHRAILNFEPYNVGLEQILNDELCVNVFPVPSRDFIYIEVFNEKIKNVCIQMLDNRSFVVEEVANRTFFGMQTFKINIAHLDKGLYIISIKSNDSKYFKKVLVAK